MNTSPRDRLQNARPEARGATGWPVRSTRAKSGAARTATVDCDLDGGLSRVSDLALAHLDTERGAAQLVFERVDATAQLRGIGAEGGGKDERRRRGCPRCIRARGSRGGNRGARRTYRSEDAIAQVQRRRGLRHGLRQGRHDRGERSHFCRAFAARGEMRLECGAFGHRQRPKHVERRLLALLVVLGAAGHVMVSVITSRSFKSACRIRVLTVPNGCSSRSAISTCVSPS